MQRPTPLPPLTSHLGYWMRYVSNHVSQAFARKLDGAGVTVAEWVLLRELYGEDALPPSRLAERLGLTRGAISKLADRLLAKGLLVREENLTDGRAHQLALSRAGEDLVPRLVELADRNDAEFFDHLSPEERQTIERILRQIVERRGLKDIPVD
ncbi:MarR family winged helix-turn-helix transcriptional regulator [Lacibacterium aquatile]|uniref:MarR family winged helix-turn-helix transcriptional regulator n=1 Tax=Lacibacterium aquatile TaxID=1168082 RepID=A0ABW5DNW9_9PROT